MLRKLIWSIALGLVLGVAVQGHAATVSYDFGGVVAWYSVDPVVGPYSGSFSYDSDTGAGFVSLTTAEFSLVALPATATLSELASAGDRLTIATPLSSPAHVQLWFDSVAELAGLPPSLTLDMFPRTPAGTMLRDVDFSYAVPGAYWEGGGAITSLTPTATTAVPEPGTLMLLGSAILGLAAVRFRLSR
jgi:hypothetical protein